MPTFRNIKISCVSQFDILMIPEYQPPKKPTDPFQNVPPLITDNSVVSVYLPMYPSSQFWLCYDIAAPHPPNALYYFKLYINGKIIVSWGCGKDEGYKGKTMFGLFSPGPRTFKHSLVERRALFFGTHDERVDTLTLDSLNDVMEIKVFRSKGRQRIDPEVQDFHNLSGEANSKSQQHATGSGLNLVNAGFLPANHPQRFYKYALIDSLDQPFATFRYYCRSYDQLAALRVISPLASPETSPIGSPDPSERSLSPKGSDNTIDSYVTVADSLNISTNPSTETIMHHANNDISNSLAAADENITTSTIETQTSIDTQEQDLSSPLRARIIQPFTLPRPGTPPPSTTPAKLTQLPPQIPQTDTALNTLASKESFASLIRTHLPSPDPSTYQLHELIAEPRPAPPSRTRSTSIGILNNALSSAKNRRKRSGEREREDVPSPAPEFSDRTNEVYASSHFVEDVTDTSLKDSSTKAAAEDDDAVTSARLGDEGVRKRLLGERRRGREGGMGERDRDSVGSGTSGSQESERKERRKERRQVHLWERL